MGKVVFIIAKDGFRDDEYFIPKKILEDAGHDIKTASNIEEGEEAIGAQGGRAKVDLNINKIEISDFDMIVFVGGPGCLQNLDNEISYKICREAIENGKIVGAICIAPLILAKAGILKGKKATVWSTKLDKTPIQILENCGAKYEDSSVVEDGNIVTANGPAAAKAFGEKLSEKLS